MPSSDYTAAELAEWEEKKTLFARWHELKAKLGTGNAAAAALGKPPSKFSQWQKIVDRDGLAGLLPRRRDCGAKPQWGTKDELTGFTGLEAKNPENHVNPVELPAWFLPAAQFFYLRSNRTQDSGSTPEAIRRAMSLPVCPPHLKEPLLAWLKEQSTGFTGLHTARSAASDNPEHHVNPVFILPTCPDELRKAIVARERAGKPMLPERLYRQIAASKIAVRALRSPRNAWLDYVQSPGSLQLTIDELTGLERYIQPGEMFTIDDGTINFVCHVPLCRPGDKCYDNFGVMVGRFQFLLVVDHRSYNIVGFNYTARPRSSYRAEDLTATLHPVFAAHGRPRVMILEHGVSAARVVTNCLSGLDIKILRASSPHQKVVESVFNILWTKLSFQRGQVGRYRGEEEEINRLLTSCREGATDPRLHFPAFGEVLGALREAIAEYNQTVKHSRYGRWVPAEFFGKEAPAVLRTMNPDTAWLFSPVITEPRQVKGSLVFATVPVMPGYTQRFAFRSDALYECADRVRLYFNPLAPDCTAAVVNARDGKFLCHAVQIDREARYTRRALEYGLDPDIGRTETAAAARALRRVSQSVGPTSAAPIIHVEQIGGAHAPSRVVIGAPADDVACGDDGRTNLGEGEVIREGATHDTRGRVCSPENNRAAQRAALAAFEAENRELLV